MALLTPDNAPAWPRAATARTAGEDAVAALGRRFRDGDVAALREAYDRWGGLVLGLARQALRNRHDAEDVVQETFVAAWRARDSFDVARAALPSWIAGVARHKIKDRLRRLQRCPTPVDPDDQRPSASTDHLDDVDRVADILLVRDALARLSGPQRRVLELSFFDQQPHAEIAAQLGLPVGTVKSHARRGLLALQRQIGARDG